jgi:hypothetical protein
MRVISPFGSDDTLLAARPPMAGRRVRKVATLLVKVNDNKSGWSLIGRRLVQFVTLSCAP